MMCVMCRDVWEGRDWEELIQSGEKFIQDGEIFICPLCHPVFEEMPLEDRITVFRGKKTLPDIVRSISALSPEEQIEIKNFIDWILKRRN